MRCKKQLTLLNFFEIFCVLEQNELKLYSLNHAKSKIRREIFLPSSVNDRLICMKAVILNTALIMPL